MKLTFFEKYGVFFVLVFISLLSWRLISFDVQKIDAYALLFPLNWVRTIPFFDVQGLLAPFESAPWWLWLEIVVTIVVWMLLLIAARGGYYFCSNLEGASMWIGFAIYIVIMIVLFATIMQPTFDQMAVWWSKWPGAGKPVYPGS